MTKEELYKAIIDELPITDIHPLHKAIMEECCETVLESNPEITDEETLVLATQTAFLTCDTIMKATLIAARESVDADVITLNYRNQTFKISKDSNLLK